MEGSRKVLVHILNFLNLFYKVTTIHQLCITKIIFMVKSTPFFALLKLHFQTCNLQLLDHETRVLMYSYFGVRGERTREVNEENLHGVPKPQPQGRP